MRNLTHTERFQIAMVGGMVAGCGLPLVISCVIAIIELLH